MKKQAPLLIVALAGIVVVGLYFGYQSLFRTKCDGLFEQTSDHLRVHFDAIKAKGDVVIGRDKVQELTGSDKRIAISLKACCLGPAGGSLDAAQYQTCLKDAHDYETRVVEVSRTVNEAQMAREQGNTPLAAQKVEQAKLAASAALGAEQALAKRVEAARAVAAAATAGAAAKPVRGGTEQEPNNTLLVANAAELGAATAGEIAPADDVDVFKFQYRDAKNRRDVVAVHLENQSTTLHPSVRLYKEDKSVARDWITPNTAGANVDFSFTATPGNTYYVAVASHWGGSTGKYTLSVVPQKAYDSHEPNDEPNSATPTEGGQSVEANIMDGEDVDWYRLSGVTAKTVTVVLENQSRTLQPAIRVHTADKAVARNWTAANAAGADLTVSFPAEPGQDYFIVVGAHWSGSAGKYKLSTR